MEHYLLLERNVLDTAVTRGKKLVFVIAQAKALALAVTNQHPASGSPGCLLACSKLMG
jgi:ATP-dependent exoDNAse (exonuclease V) alpha subunit